MADISELGYQTIAAVDTIRADIMDQVATVATSNSGTNTIDFTKNVTLAGGGTGQASKLAGLSSVGNAVDITTGAGALVLDDVLQAMSTVEQTAAQLVSAENKAQQQVNSLARQ